jgi:hypothetical protein
MANAIRYSTTGDTQSLKSGNFFFGVGDVGKGPSSATTYYNGITPVVSGYTIYTYNASQTSKISFASANSDSELVTITNNLSGQNFTTATQCLNWYVTQSNYVCVNKDYENIVTNGLVMNLDASYDPSYTSSGTTWYDLAYSGNNGTLVNGPTFNPLNEGSIVFDGVNDFVEIPYGTYWDTNVFGTATNFTLECWYKPNLFKNWDTMIMKWNPNLGGWYSSPQGAAIWSDVNGFVAVFSSGVSDNPTGSYVQIFYATTAFKWYHLCFTSDGNTLLFYVDGILRGTNLVSNRTVPVTTSSNGPTLGRRAYMNGQMSSVKLYTQGITQQQVLQNYQAQFPRFLGKNIVTNGLVQYLDAGYVNSYPTTGTTWTNVSGVSGATGTLTNGPTYSGGTINFDGTNDYVDCGSGSSLNLRFLTLDCWVNPSIVSGGNGAHRHLIAYELCYKVRFNGDSIQVLLGDGTNWHTYIDTNFGIINANSWYNVTVNVTPLNTCNIYVNGVLTKTQNTGAIGNNERKLFIGAYDNGGGTPFGFFNGKMSSSSIYNRALTQSEILQNYQAQFPQILGENIITNGLVLYLDAGYRTSYPTTGTTWNNVSGVSGGTGTLTNGPTYDSGNGGSIVFDGVDDKVDCGDPPSLRLSSTLTIQVIFYINSYNIWAGLIGKNSNIKSVYGLNLSPTSQRLRFNYNNIAPWTNNVETTSTISTGQWIIASVTYDGENVRFYLNGVLDKTQYIGSVTFDTSAGYPLDIGWDNPGGDEYFNGKIAQASIYNRALTQNEIQQNFNAQKSRYGL